MNNKKISSLINKLLIEIGENPKREGLKHTPKRVAASFEAMFSGYSKNPKDIKTVFKNENYDEMVIMKNIEFYSMCEHHLLPFFGTIHIGYVPDKTIIGLSKLPRLVEIYSRRLQNQERLTAQIAQKLHDMLSPKGVGVIIEAKHLCILARGIQKQRSQITTSSLKGIFKQNINTRSEFLRLIHF